MSRRRRILLWAAGGTLAIVLVLGLAGILIVQTGWFRNLVREKIVTSVEEATGGKVDIASFQFDWRHLRAQVRGFTIHGSEPATGPPLLQAKLVQVDLKILSPFRGFVDLAYLLVETPQANVMVYADGHTNIPAPKVPPKSNGKTGLESIVDLAIGRFDLRNGALTFANRKSEWNASGANLRAQLNYRMLPARYSGEIDIAPLYFRAGNNRPLDVNVKLPLTLEKDKITLRSAQLTTPESSVAISGSMDHLVAPRTTLQVNARISVDEMGRALSPGTLDTAHGPRFLTADAAGSMDEAGIRIQSARATLGRSTIEASGVLQASAGGNLMQFSSELSLSEIGTLLRVQAHPEGNVNVRGNAALDAANHYSVQAKVEARNVAARLGEARVSNVRLDSEVNAGNRRIELSAIRLQAFGGEFDGSARIEDLAAYHVSGKLRGFAIQALGRAFAPSAAAYDGVISGPVSADGNLRDAMALAAKANLAIVPGRRGIPVSGHLGVDYQARNGSLNVDRSHIALPHTTADFSGSLNREIQVRLNTRSFDDLRPIAEVPVTFQGTGSGAVTATITGKLAAPHVSGQIAMNNFAVRGRTFGQFGASVEASPSGARVQNASIRRGQMQAEFSGTVGLKNWKPENNQPIRADFLMRNADLSDALALADSSLSARGALTARAQISGTIGSPVGSADLTVEHGAIDGQGFDRFGAHADLSRTSIQVPKCSLVAGPSRVELTASYQHEVNDLEKGTLTAHVKSSQVQLAQFQALVKDRPGLAGIVNLDANVNAGVSPSATGTQIQIANLNANLSARDLAMEGKRLGDFTATAATAGNQIEYNVNSNFAGSTIRVKGQSQLDGDHRTAATADISGLPVDRLLALAGRHEIPLRGTLSANARFSGTLENPEAGGTFNIANGAAYGEPFTRVVGSIDYTAASIDVKQLRVDDGASHVEIAGSFRHPPKNLEDGELRFSARSNAVDLAQIHTLAKVRPGLAGSLELNATGAATLHAGAAPSVSALNANVSAKNLRVDNKAIGNLEATAKTEGTSVAINLTSNLAQAQIRGAGKIALSAGYPVDAQVAFSGLTWSGIAPLTGAGDQPFDGSLDGKASVSGSANDLNGLRGKLELTKLEVQSVQAGPAKSARGSFELHNDGNVEASFDHSMVTVQSFRLTGRDANLSITGTAALKSASGSQSVNLRASGKVNLSLLEAFGPDIYSSGAITLNASMAGSVSQPTVNGTIQLQDAAVNLPGMPVGFSKGKGAIHFNGTEAVLDNVTGVSGGGPVTLTGFFSYGGEQDHFQIQARATRVHINYPETVTTEANARLELSGTESRSLLSGNITVVSVGLHSQSDIGSILSSATAPPAAPAPSTGLLAGMRFDVRIRTSTGIQFRSDLAQNLDAEADLTLRGTPDNPGMIGRVTVNSGELIFFGGRYTVDQGTITFSNPNLIEPVLNVDLETTAQSVDVTIHVSGPMDKLKMTYHSDPPLEFQQLVSLLAAGQTPTTDPVIASQQPPAPQQSFQQAGASAILGQAVANPISGRLQRLFGVSKLSINPQIVGETTNNPQATLMLQQQITRNITFTYIQDVTQSTPSAIRVEWQVNPHYSVVAQRDVFGEFAIDLFYKKRFH